MVYALAAMLAHHAGADVPGHFGGRRLHDPPSNAASVLQGKVHVSSTKTVQYQCLHGAKQGPREELSQNRVKSAVEILSLLY